MNDVIPEQGLGPQNQKWRQWVERSVTGTTRMISRLKDDVNNSFKAITSSMGAITRQIEELSAQGAELEAQSNYLSGLKTSAVTGPLFLLYNSIPGDNVHRYFDTGSSVVLKVPTSRVIVTTSSSMVLVNPGSGGAEGYVAFSVTQVGGSQVVGPDYGRSTRVWTYESYIAVGGSSDHIVTVPDPNAEYEFRLWVGHSSTATATLADVRIDEPRLIVQVIDPA